MSVAGFDIGNVSSCVALARKGGVDILLNKESKRETASVVAFGPKTRAIGTDGVPSLATNPQNTVFQLKRLIGKNFSDPKLQQDIKSLPYKVVEGPKGEAHIEVNYLDQKSTFRPEQVLAMMLVDLKQIAEKDQGCPVTDCVLSCPVYYTEAERSTVLHAAKVAGLDCLRLLNETTATALAYGIYKTDLPEKDPINVCFVDFGNQSVQVSVVAFKKGQLQVLSHGWDRDVGGRMFDELLFNHFAAEFKEKYKIDVHNSARACFRLLTGCEKLKKTLSANPEATINIECLMDDKDVSGHLTREAFEQMAQPVFERMRKPFEAAIKDAGLTLEQINSVELVGGSSRMPGILRELASYFGKEPSRTLHAKEAVARGCALQCAMLSPLFRVREFEVIDLFPYSIGVSWEKDGEQTTSVLFERGCNVPSAKLLTFHRNAEFDIKAFYTEDADLPASFSKEVATFHVGPLQVPEGKDKVKLKVKVRLNLNSIVSVESVQQVEEEEVPVEEEPAKEAPAAAGDQPMADAAEAGASAGPDDAAAPKEEGGEAAAMQTDKAEGDEAAAAPKTKKKVTKKSVPFAVHTPSLSQAEMQELFEVECQMALTARVFEETNDAKNAVESYLLDLRHKLSDEYAPYAKDDDRSALSSVLDKTEDWLYEEGEDQPKKVYVAKLEELQKLGDPIAARYQEDRARPTAAAALEATCNTWLAAATGGEAKYAHIAQEDKDKVADEARKALAWLADKRAQQEGLAKTAEPALTVADLRKKEDTVARFCQPLMSKPPPPPPKKEEPKVEEPKEEPKGEAKAEEGAATADQPMDTDDQPAEGEPMQADK